MKKASVEILILGLILASLGSSIGMGEKPETEETMNANVVTQENPPSMEVISSSGNYVVQVDYEDFNSWRGHGKVYYTVKNKDGEVLDKFSSEISPLEAFVSNGGNIVAFGGDRTEAIFIDKICFYDVKGNLLKKHNVEITMPAGNVISDDGKYFVLGYQHRGKKGLSLFDMETGEKMWDKSLDIRPDEVMVSNNAKWIVAIGRTKRWDAVKKFSPEYEILLFNKLGRKYWEKRIERVSSDKIYRLGHISDDGAIFEVNEVESKFNKQKNVYERTIKKRIVFKNTKGKVKIDKIIDIKQERLRDKK